MSPKVDQDFHGAHVDFPFNGSGAASLRDGRFGCEQYTLFFILRVLKVSRCRKKSKADNTSTNGYLSLFFSEWYIYGGVD